MGRHQNREKGKERKAKQKKGKKSKPKRSQINIETSWPKSKQKKMMILKEFEDKGWERYQKSETRSWDTDSYVLENQKFLKQFNFPRTPLSKNAPPPILKWLPFTSRLVFDFRTKSILEGRKRSMNFNKFN